MQVRQAQQQGLPGRGVADDRQLNQREPARTPTIGPLPVSNSFFFFLWSFFPLNLLMFEVLFPEDEIEDGDCLAW